MSTQVDLIKYKYERIQEEIFNAARKVGRDPGQIKIVVVTKTHPVNVIQSVLEAGILMLGENYADEAVSKMKVIGKKPGLEWHMIGHIQSRKASTVCENFDVVHSLDSLKLAHRMNRILADENRIMPVFLECNTSGEETKHGWHIAHEEQWPVVMNEFEQILGLSHLRIQGLMTMAPYSENPEASRPFFRRLTGFQTRLKAEFAGSSWSELSMGMSGDFKVAVEEGSTYVRIGQAILGPRER